MYIPCRPAWRGSSPRPLSRTTWRDSRWPHGLSPRVRGGPPTYQRISKDKSMVESTWWAKKHGRHLCYTHQKQPRNKHNRSGRARNKHALATYALYSTEYCWKTKQKKRAPMYRPYCLHACTVQQTNIELILLKTAATTLFTRLAPI